MAITMASNELCRKNCVILEGLSKSFEILLLTNAVITKIHMHNSILNTLVTEPTKEAISHAN